MKKSITFLLVLLAYISAMLIVTSPTMAVPNHGTVFEDYAYVCPLGTPPTCTYYPNGTCWMDV